MILSKSCIYAIQAAIYVAAEGKGGYVPISQIAEKMQISFHFLTKVLQQFSHAGLMTSYRGPKGGVALSRPIDEVSLYDLVAAVDGTDVFTECMLGLPGCGHAAPCPAHEHWIQVRQQFTSIAQNVTLRQLAQRAGELHVRLANVIKP